MNQTHNLRVIKTARTEEAINKAAANGYMPLVKSIVPNAAIKAKFAILQHPTTGKIEVINDFRAQGNDKEMIKALDFTFYYPHSFPSPFAAYLIPKDIEVGEEVWLDDLIEDIAGVEWNQGDCHRLPSCKATWTGDDFVLHVPKDRHAIIVG